MIRHLFTLIWNNKRTNLLLMIEILISFVVLFVVFTIGTQNFNTYRQPLGFSRDAIWYIQVGLSDITDEQGIALLDRLENRLINLPETVDITFVKDAAPYQSQFTAYKHQVRFDKQVINQVTEWKVDERFATVMKLDIQEGRWFRQADYGQSKPPIVINSMLKEALFGNASALGKVISVEDAYYTVAGVVSHYRRSENERETPGYFTQVTLTDTLNGLPGEILIQVKSGTGAAFGEKLAKEAGAAVGQAGWQYIDAISLDEQRDQYLGTDTTQILITVTICVFLIVNVVIGIFGVLSQNIHRRYAEIGIRRAMGATGKRIYAQMISEVIVLATLSIVPGLVLALQFFLFNPFGFALQSYIMGIVLASGTIYILITLCAIYPSRKAARVQPAVALHAE